MKEKQRHSGRFESEPDVLFLLFLFKKFRATGPMAVLLGLPNAAAAVKIKNPPADTLRPLLQGQNFHFRPNVPVCVCV
jgi:hypothetical protein